MKGHGGLHGGTPQDAIEIDDSEEENNNNNNNDGNGVISMHDTDRQPEEVHPTSLNPSDSPEVIDLLSSSSSSSSLYSSYLSSSSSSSFTNDDSGHKVVASLPRSPKLVGKSTPASAKSIRSASSRHSQPYTAARKRFSSPAVASKPKMGQCPLCQQECPLEDLSSHIEACSISRSQEHSAQRELVFDDAGGEGDQKLPAKPSIATVTTPPRRSTTKEDSEDSIASRRSLHPPLPRENNDNDDKDNNKSPESERIDVHTGKAGNFPKEVRRQVEKLLRKVRSKRTQQKKALWRQAMHRKNQFMRTLQRPKQPLVEYAPLPEQSAITVLESAYCHEPDYPLPSREDHTALHTKHLSSKKALEHEVDDLSNKEQKPPTPKFEAAELSSDDSSISSEKILSPNQIQYKVQITAFQNPDLVGVGAELDEQDDDIDQVLQSIRATRSSALTSFQARKYLSILLQVSLDHVEERWKNLYPVPEPAKTYATLYEKVNSTYRSLFCRSCMVIDCNYHGIQGEDRPADIELELFHRAQDAKHFERKVPSKRLMYCLPVGTNPFEEDIPDVAARKNFVLPPVPMMGWEQKVLSETEVGICQRLYQVYRGDVARVSKTARIPEQIIQAQCNLDAVTFAYKLPNEWFRGNKKRPIPEWTKNPETNNIRRPFAKPCTHMGICNEENCPCIQNRYFCTHRCLWGRFSPNFFPGCICKKQCRINCPCFIANRECDPEVCGCDTCTHPEQQRVTGEEGGQQCRNDELSMRRHAHLLVGKSTVHGFGCFAKTAIQKNEVIDEYIGELITHNEAEQRGEELEGKNLSLYIFDLGSDYAIDARCKGNKTRFINHSDHPNVGTKLKIVIGEYHIQFYALKFIPAEAELFFDYGSKFFKKTNEKQAGVNKFLSPTKKARTKSQQP